VTDEFMAMKAISSPGWNLTKISTGLQETRTMPPVALDQWSSQPTHSKHAPDMTTQQVKGRHDIH